MRRNFPDFFKQSLKNCFEAIANVVVFLPYFFSVKELLNTLFFPWKNLVAKKTAAGFSFNEWGTRILFNLISRAIGFVMRISVFTFYIILQIGFVLAIPFIVIIYILYIPLAYLETTVSKTDEERKKIFRNTFIEGHLLRKGNRHAVEQWFELYYDLYIKKTAWWTLQNLFSIPPLARDWSTGFTPILDRYARELTTPTYQVRREHVVDRKKEIADIEQILSRAEEAHVVVVGEEGVGKHTIIDAFAKKIYEGKTNILLMYSRVLALNMERICNEYTEQKQRENFFDGLLQEATDARNCIIVINDLENYISSETGKVDLSSSFKKCMNSGVRFIGMTHPNGYQKYILPNDSINRMFTKIDVFEISEREAEEILLENAYTYEKKYGVLIPYETIHAVIGKSGSFITMIPFPEKALHLLDRSCSYAKSHTQTMVFPEFVDTVLSGETHVPTVLTPDLKEKLLTLESKLSKEIVQQEHAIIKLVSTLQRSFVLVGKRRNPLASFLFLGPTGVGKTQTAKSIAEIFFGGERYLIRFDMSEFQRLADIEKCIGLLSSSIREHPYGVLLLDEFEKANAKLLNIFLTVLDEGYITDGMGKRVDCKNLIIIATSNAASSELYVHPLLEESLLIDSLVRQKLFSPELLNRFDGIILYKPLTEESVVVIAQRIVDQVAKDIYHNHKISLAVSKKYLTDLAEKDYDPRFGARNMERLIRMSIEEKVAKMILENKLQEGDIIRL